MLSESSNDALSHAEDKIMDDEKDEMRLQEQIALVQDRLAKRAVPEQVSEETIKTAVGGGAVGASTESEKQILNPNPLKTNTPTVTSSSTVGELPASPTMREFHYHPGGHYHPGQFSDILNPAYMKWVNQKLGGLRFLGAVRQLLFEEEVEPLRRLLAWSCCADPAIEAVGCKIRQNSPPRYHPGKCWLAVFCETETV